MRLWVLGGLLLVAAAPAGASPPALEAQLACQPEVGSSRLICNVDYRCASGSRLVWADAVVTAAPAFVRPLRARVSATLERDGEHGRAGIALVPIGAGSGKLGVRARAVICGGGRATDAASCSPLERELTAALTLP